MTKPTIILLFFIAVTNGYSQGIYFRTGKNYTKYKFKSTTETTNIDFQIGTGTNFEIGYLKTFKNKKFGYNIGLTLDEYNSTANSDLNIYNWKTEYVGIKNSFQFNIIETTYFDIDTKIGLNINTIIYGKQKTNSLLFDLTKEKEFSGLVLIPFIGIQVKSKLSEYGYLSFGYNYSTGINVSNSSDEKLSFYTKQIQFGIHLKVNKKIIEKVNEKVNEESNEMRYEKEY